MHVIFKDSQFKKTKKQHIFQKEPKSKAPH